MRPGARSDLPAGSPQAAEHPAGEERRKEGVKQRNQKQGIAFPLPCSQSVSQSVSLQPGKQRSLLHARTHLAFLQGWGAFARGGGTRLEKKREGRGLAAGLREQLEAIGEGGRNQGTPDRLEGPRRGAETQGRRAGAHGRACSRVPGGCAATCRNSIQGPVRAQEAAEEPERPR